MISPSPLHFVTPRCTGHDRSPHSQRIFMRFHDHPHALPTGVTVGFGPVFYRCTFSGGVIDFEESADRRGVVTDLANVIERCQPLERKWRAGRMSVAQ